MELTPELAKTMLGFSIVIIDVLGSGNAPLGCGWYSELLDECEFYSLEWD
jgi:hypothetical protein